MPDEAQATLMRIVVVHWKIKPGRERDFLEYWTTRSIVENRAGLVAEFLSSKADEKTAPWITMASLDPSYTSFFNVGIWRNAAAFQDQIGRFIDNSRPPLEFEAAKRERVFLVPERWRIGQGSLPANDLPGVR